MVMAFYYTWYGSRSYSGAWRHWNEGGHQPDRLGAGGMPDIGATDHPVELYDSHDPELLRRHLKAAQECGIDALIPTWWAPGDWHDEALALLLKEAQPTPVKVSAYYETIPVDEPDRVAATAKSLLYLLETHGSSPAFLKDARGAPVIFVYSRAMGQLTRDEWAEALRRVRARHAVCAIADSTDPSWLDLFDGLHEYNPVGAVVVGEDLKARAAGLVSAARSKPGHKIACATVIPGYDDSHIGRATPTIAPRAGGDTYRRMWSAALGAKPDWALICSFNEWHEGSEIETSREWGDRYQRLTSDFSQLLHSGKQVVLKGTGLSGVDVRPTPGLLLSVEGDGKGPITLRNLALMPGEAEVRWGRPEDVVAFELGPEDRLWRLVPSEGLQKAPLRFAVGSGRSYQVWKREDLAKALPQSPFATPTALRLDPKLSSSYPASEPNRYRVFPGHSFPIEVSLRNRGRATVTAGRARLQAPEGWGSGEAPLFDALAPGASARARLEVTPPASADLNQPYPVLVWLSFTEGGQETTFWAPVELAPERPLEPSFAFGGDGSLRIALKSAFADLTLNPVTLDLVAGEGRSA
ncbi:MAG TPA: NEW3 domain-containing protein, partial [Armatimonadota bacterium]